MNTPIGNASMSCASQSVANCKISLLPNRGYLTRLQPVNQAFQARQRFFPSQDDSDVEDRRRRTATGERDAKRMNVFRGAQSARLGESAQGLLARGHVERFCLRERVVQIAHALRKIIALEMF